MKNILLFSLLIFLASIFGKDIRAQQFCATVTAGSISSGVVQDNNGNYIVSGISTVSNKNILVKITENANLEWIKEYTFSPSTPFWSSKDLIITQDGDFVGVGLADELQVYKVDSLGNMKWITRYTQYMEVTKVLELIDKSLIVTSNLGTDVIIIKLDQNGNTIWSKLYGSPNSGDYAYSAVLENDSLQFSLIGRSDGGSWLTTFDSSGYEINSKYIGPDGFYHRVVNTSDGGKAFSYYDWTDNIYFGKLSSNNTIEWIKTTKYDPNSIWAGLFMSIIEKNSGELVFCYLEDQVGYSPCILSMDLSGNFISAHYIDNWIEKLMNTKDGGVIGVGQNYTTGSIQISKFDNQMNSCCLTSVTLSYNNYNLGNINLNKSVTPVTLVSQSVSATSINLTGYTLDCYIPVVISVEELTTSNITVYPTLANNVLSISSVKEIGEIKIYNLLGEIIIKKAVNKNEDKIDVSYLTSGIYILEVSGKRVKFVKE